MNARRGALCLISAAVACACAWPGLFGKAGLADCPGPLVDVAAIPGGDFLLRERLRVRGAEVEWSLELVAERRGDRLVLVALDAFGARAFDVEQRGSVVTSTSRFGRRLPLSPENALRDLHAARFAKPDDGGRVELTRPGCDYRATFVRIERRELGFRKPLLPSRLGDDRRTGTVTSDAS